MKNTGTITAIAAFVLAALAFAPVMRGASQAQTDAEATALLTTNKWFFKGQNWGNYRTFHADGTFSSRKSGTWKIDNGMVLLTFPDHVDKLILPIDPKGTKGIDANGLPLMAYQEAPDASIPTIAPVVPASFASVPAAIKATMTQGQWYIQGMTWAAVREFKPDGTFTTQRNPGETGSWTVDNGALVLNFVSSAQDKIFLPLNPKGSKGVDSKGGRMLAIQQPLAEPAPDLVPPKEVTPAMIQDGKNSKQTAVEAADLLTEGQWYFQGVSWANTRVFNLDGSFKGGGDGSWDVGDGVVVMDSNGRQDKFILPVNPNGTIGIDSAGNPMIARRQALKQPPARMAGITTPNRSAQTDAMVTAALVQGQWYFQGLSWANTRVFRPDGTFYTQRRPGEGGTWKIVDGYVVLVFKSSENTLMLPVDPQFTIGQDSEGIPMIVYNQPLSESEPPPAGHIAQSHTPRPAGGTATNTPPPFGVTNPSGVAATPTPKPGGPTPAYFGVEHPQDLMGTPPPQ